MVGTPKIVFKYLNLRTNNAKILAISNIFYVLFEKSTVSLKRQSVLFGLSGPGSGPRLNEKL